MLNSRDVTLEWVRWRRWRGALACVALLSALVGGAGLPARLAAQYLEERSTSGLSRTMQLAIRDYDDGRDVEAMDGFMEVLAKGDPAERGMANEYINLITQRMYIGSTINTKPNAPMPRPATVTEPLPLPREGSMPGRRPGPEVDTQPYYDRPDRMPSRIEAEPPRASKAVMRKEIDAKVRALARSYLTDLESYPEIRVLMADRLHPRALGIPADALFESGIVFKKSAKNILQTLSGLVYCLGATQVAILPEGTVVGDAKILDMRRTMGVSAHFYQSGIAPPRVRVNLLNTQIEIPRGMLDFRGIMIVFVYNQPLTLTSDSTLGDDGGPPVSLGVWPEKFRADRGEGAIIEFSVVEPPAGLTTWKFQLRHPGAGRGSDLIPLQEVVGAAPVFHQIYWNGRRNYFGPELVPGRYELVVTSTDGRNRTRTLHRWVQLDGVAPAPVVAAAPNVPATSASAEPTPALSAEVKPAAGKAAPVAYVQLAKKPKELPIRCKKGHKCKQKARPKPKKQVDPLEYAEAPPDPEPEPSPAPTGATGTDPTGNPAPSPAPQNGQANQGATGGKTVTYKVPFAAGSLQMAPEGDRAVVQIVEVLQNYPRENVNVVGIASQSEPDAAGLASKRADMVVKLLMSSYGVDAKRIQKETKVVPEELHEVQIYSVTAKE